MESERIPIYLCIIAFLFLIQVSLSYLTSTDAPYKRVDTCAINRVQGSVAVILG